MPLRLCANNTQKVIFVQFNNEINGGEKGHEVQRKIDVQSEIDIVTLQYLCSLNRFSVCRKIVQIALCASSTCCNVY